MTFKGVRVDDTFAEAFPMTAARLIGLLWPRPDYGTTRSIVTCTGLAAAKS